MNDRACNSVPLCILDDVPDGGGLEAGSRGRGAAQRGSRVGVSQCMPALLHTVEL